VNESLDLDTVLATGLDKVVEILQADAGYVSLAAERGFVMAGHRGLSPAFVAALAAQGPGEGFCAHVAARDETVVVPDVTAGPFPLPAFRREGLTTLLGVPLKAQGTLHGVLVLATRERRRFSADDLYFAAAAGAQLAAAVERALLFRRQEQRVARERRLLEAAETLNRSLDSPALTRTILTEAADLMGAAKAALLAIRGEVLVAEEVHNLSDEYRRLFCLPLSDSLSGTAVVEGRTVAVEDVDAEPLVDQVLVREGGYRSFLTAPLRSYKGTRGALSVYYDEPRRFSEDDRTLLRTFAVQAAIALDNQRLMREKDEMALRDGLTGVYNRTYLELALDRLVKEARRRNSLASVLFLDVDDLKMVNDTHGHAAGDTLLTDLAGILTSCSRESDVVTRYGGDEFVILMPDTDAAGAQAVAAKIAAAVRRRNSDEHALPLSVSMGRHTAVGAEVSDLLRAADREMYAMKRARRNA
jgi:diguanylate cyclase (GGDEF)-like protein